MSDTRRRRKSNNSGGSEDLSDSYEELNAVKETQNSDVNETEENHESEYEIGGSESDIDSQEGGLRESGDGQEEDKPQKKLDDDEDRRNPQYIPKRGTFYEHDDRTAEEAPEENGDTPSERDAKEKKVWKDKEDRWDHDRYNDEEQAPKSHDELVAVYGYDIRNEEGPPRARRRRRYGRGPNKYTRNWEDEDAYGKPGGNVTPGKGNNRKPNRPGEEFPALGGNNKDDAQTTSEEPVISSAWYSNKNKSQPRGQNFPPLNPQESQNSKNSSANNVTPTNENKVSNEPTNPAWKKESKQVTRNESPNRSGGGGDADKLINHKPSPRDLNKRQVQESVSLAASRARGRGFKQPANTNNVANNRSDYKSKGRGSGTGLTDNRRNNGDAPGDDHQLINDLKQLNVNEGAPFQQANRQGKNVYPQSPGQARPNTVPPRMQQQQSQQQMSPRQQQPQHDAAGNRPKRYSSLRQRPAVPDGPGQPGFQPQHGQHGYYPQAGNSRGVIESQGYPPGHFDQQNPVPTTAAPLAGQPVLPLAPAAPSANFAPPPFMVPPPQFMPPQPAPPSIINYVQGPNGPAFQPNFQGYQGYSPPVQPPGPPPPQELFQPQGCTYYSPAQQQQQAVPMRRPKAAIPILPPPDTQHHQSSRGRGRTTQQQQQLQQNHVGSGSVQQSQLEGKNAIEPGDDQFSSEQFANAQSEQQTKEAVRTEEQEDGSTSGDGDVEPNTVNTEVQSNGETAKDLKDNVDVVVARDTTPVGDEAVAKSVESSNIVNSESLELAKSENAVSDSIVVEEAAA